MSDSVQPHRWQPTMLPHPWDSPGKKTGVGCHFLLQFMKVKSESEVAQSCPTLSNPMDCSLPGSSIYGISQVRVLAHVSPLCTKFLWQDRTLIENKIWYRSLEKPIAVSEPFVHAKISLAAPKFYSLSQKSTYLHRSKVTLGLGLLFYKFDFWKIH